MSTVKEICRFICGLIDSVIYEIISKMYDLFYEIADLILYSQEMFDAIGKRIVLILGIFMLFRLAISLVSYLISPDKLKDNSKGGAKMVINIIVSVVLLSTVNIIFVQAYKVQKKVVDSKIVEKIFFGERAEIPNLDIAYILYSGFITPNVNILPGCENLFNTYIPIEPKCQESFSSANISGDAKKVIKEDVLQKHDLNEVFKEYSLLNAKYNGEYLFEYMPIVSTVAGIIITFVLISFSMDLALRSVKMIFLQIIAPIPIIANMDPGKGSEIFKKWYKETITTYVSLFIRIIAISFAVFLITLITVNFSDVFKGRSTLLTVLLIIGCLMFAKQVPKLIEDMLGIKMEGMALNPLKKFQEQALFGKNITGLAAAGLAGTAVAGSNMVSRFAMGAGERGFARVWDMTLGTLASGVAGGISATTRGTVGAIRGQKFGQVYGGAYAGAIKARQNRNSRIDEGVIAPQVWLNSLQRKMGIETVAERDNQRIDTYDKMKSYVDTAKNIAEAEIVKRENDINLGAGLISSLAGQGINVSTLGELSAAMNDSNLNNIQRALAAQHYNEQKGKYADQYIDNASNISLNGDAFDSIKLKTAQANFNGAKQLFTQEKLGNDQYFISEGIISISSVKDFKKAGKAAEKASVETKTSTSYQQHQKIQEQTNREKK